MIFAFEDRNAVLHVREPVSEQELFQDVTRVAQKLFAGYTMHAWSPLVRDRRCRKSKPDAVLIRDDRREWFVIEFELAHHSIMHIDDQLNKLADGIYDLELTTTFTTHIGLSTSEASALLRHSPQFLCIVNEEREGIRRVCRQAGFDVMVVQPFVSFDGVQGVLASHVPTFLTRGIRPTVFGLRRGNLFGNKMFMEVPVNFPITIGMLQLVLVDGLFLDCLFDGRSLHLLAENVRPGYSYSLRVIDIQRRIFKLEEERTE